MIVQMEKIPTSTSKEHAQQLYKKNVELESKRQKSLQARRPSDPNAWYQIRENYEAIILEDHAFSEQHNIEFGLWQLHYKRIEEFRAHFNAAQASERSSATNSGRGPPQPDRMSKIRVQFKAFLSDATGFYHDLILKIRAKYGLPLGHFSDDLDNQDIMGTDSAKSSDVKKALVSCHQCLIYLGDLARYKGLYGEGESRAREYSAASSNYLQAVSLWPSNGNSHHQLAILATYSSDELVAFYRYFRSLAAEIPFSTAKDNLVIAFEKNRQSHTQLLETLTTVGDRKISMKERYKEFCTQFVRLHGILFSRTSLESFPSVLSSVSDVLHELLSSGPEEEQNFGTDGLENGLAILRLVAVIIFTVHNLNKKNEDQTYAEILQHNVLFENAWNLTFELMSLIVERCLLLHDPSSSFLLPGILVFLEWLTCFSTEEKNSTAAKFSFWKHCVALFNKLLSNRTVSVDDDGDETCFSNMSRYEEGETDSRLALWEDFELRGFLPLLPVQNILDFSRKQFVGFGRSSREKETRIKRVIAAGKALASVAMIDQKAVSFDSKGNQFVIVESPLTQHEIGAPSVNNLVMQGNIPLIFEGEDEDEEIVFKPVFTSDQQHHLMMDLHNPTWFVEQQASLQDGFKQLRFVENGSVLSSEIKGGSPSLPHPSISFMNNVMFSENTRAPSAMISSRLDSVAFSEVTTNSVAIKPPPNSLASFKSPVGRSVRHLGPPPGFRPVPPRHVGIPIPNLDRKTGSLAVDDHSWLNGYQKPSSTTSVGPNHISNQVLSLGSNENGGVPFPGIQASALQFQGGNLNPNHGHELLEQQHIMTGNQFTSQPEHYYGQSTWTGRYRV